jgi:hypothetical protein
MNIGDLTIEPVYGGVMNAVYPIGESGAGLSPRSSAEAILIITLAASITRIQI